MFRVLYIFTMLFCFLSCQPKKKSSNDLYENLSKSEGGEIIKKAIDFYGGWENWINKKNLLFTKIITQYDSLGTIKNTESQKHIYQLENGFKAHLSYKVENDSFLIINDGMQAKKYKNLIELTDQKSKDEAWDTSFGSHYSMSMPFKLADEGLTLIYEGIDTLIFDRPVHSVKIEYANGAGSTGGMHLWWYYFDADNYELVGNFLDHGKGYTLNVYEGIQEVDGIKLHKKRRSYNSNKNKERVMLKTIYESENIRFNETINESIFTLW